MSLNEYIREKEKGTHLIEIRYGDIPVWLSLRKHFYALYNKGIYQVTPHIIRKPGKLLRSFFYGWKYWFMKSDHWFFTSSITRRLIDGNWVDIFSDYPASMLANSWILEYTLQGHFPGKKLYFKNVSSLVPVIHLEKLLRPVLLDRNAIKDIRKDIEKAFPTEEFDRIDIDHDVFKIYFQYRFLKWVLKIKKAPKIAFFVPSYTNFGFIRALKEKGSRIVEIQHGVISQEHFGYNYPSSFPEIYFPDHLLTFGSMPRVESQYWDVVQQVPVGSFVIDHYLQSLHPSKEIEKHRFRYKRIFGVSLQDCETGMQLITHLIKIALNLPEELFLMKRRRTSREFYQKQYSFPENVQFCEDLNVYELILQTDFHITAYSSTALEAPALGKQNILFNINNKARNYYGSILKENVNSFYVENAIEFDSLRRRLSPENPDWIRESNKEVIRPDYQINILQFLSTIKNRE